MKTWQQATRDSVLSGAVTSILSTAVLAANGRKENRSLFAPTNAVSHYLFGDKAALQNHPSLKYTALGYLIHHASANFWAVFYEKWFGEVAERKGVAPALAAGLAVAGVACFADYKLTPRGWEPGYEKRLSRKALFVVYGAVGIGMALTSVACEMQRRRERQGMMPARQLS